MTEARRRALARVLHLRAVARSEGDTPQGTTATSIAERIARKHDLHPEQIDAAEAAQAARAQRSPRDSIVIAETRYWVQSAYISLALCIGLPAGIVGQGQLQIGPGEGPSGWTPALVRHEVQRAVRWIEVAGAPAAAALAAERRAAAQVRTAPPKSGGYFIWRTPPPPRDLSEDECADAAWFVVANAALGPAIEALSQLTAVRVQELIQRMELDKRAQMHAEQAPRAEAASDAPPPDAPPPKAPPSDAPPPGENEARRMDAVVQEHKRATRVLAEARAASGIRSVDLSALRAVGSALTSRWKGLDPVTAAHGEDDAPMLALSGPVGE